MVSELHRDGMMTTSQMLGGRWVMPTVERNDSGVVAMHVSIAVDEAGAIDGQPVGVALVAGGQQLAVREPPPDGVYYYLETLAVTAVAHTSFDNPDGLAVETITITFGGESGSWQMGEPTTPPPGDLPVA